MRPPSAAGRAATTARAVSEDYSSSRRGTRSFATTASGTGYEIGERMDVNGAVALVTGGASGLGLATTEKLLDAGASAVVLDLPGSNGAEVAEKLGAKVRFAPGNVTSESDVAAALDVAAELGQLRVAVNCAGTGNAIRTLGRQGPFPLDAFTKIIKINLIGTFNVIRLARSASRRATPSTASAASSSTPPRSRRATARSGRRPTRRLILQRRFGVS
jgi:NAD(P)-dependent dehydrogenase (short-subunit alcohol dehydrogenase family)